MKKPAVIFLAALILVLAGPSAEAARKRPSGGPVVKEVTLVGNVYLGEGAIKSVMRTKASKFLRKRRLRESTLESDLVSVVALYKRNGFIKAEATVQELRYDEERTRAWVTIKVVEGPQTIVKDVVVEGNNRVAGDALRRILTVKAGEPLDEKAIGEDKYNIYAYYADKGFVFASIAHKLEGPDGEATITYTINEGEPAGIARIDVRGNANIKPRLVRREVLLKPGDIFSRQKVLDSQQRLYDTGYFKDVEIEPSQSRSDSGLVDLIVKVKERKVRETSAGLGYGTRDEARLTLGWLHRNLWNAGRQIEVRTILASGNFEKGLTRKRGDISFTDRWLFGRRLVGSISLFVNETLEEYKELVDATYTLDRVGVNLGVQRDLSRKAKLTLAYTHEIVDIRNLSWDVEDPEELRISLGQEVNRSALLSAERDARVPFFDPHRGSLTRIAARTSGGIFGGDNSYTKVTLGYARYLGFNRRSVLALGVKAGHAEAFGKSKSKGVPDYERFVVGGSSTIRGYDEREFGPGNFFLVGNVEFRYPIVWKLVGVAFFDMGNAWNSIRDVKRSDFDLHVPTDEYTLRRATDVKYSTGVGVGIETPVGPARIDYGLRLKRGMIGPVKKEGLGMIHVTIGHAF
ncbi:MAG: BamA/TamA family outer membrane protein [Candidatus Eisenbacteria bacterium]